MDAKTRIKILELSFNIMENLLMSKDFKSKEEVMSATKKAVNLSKENDKLPIEVKLGYAEAYKQLNGLSWEEMLEIKEIIGND